jgi:FkbM family methyltransferase
MTIIRLIPGMDLSRSDENAFRSETGPKRAVMYGPYENRAPGHYKVSFAVGLDDTVPLGDPVCCILDVSTNEGTTTLVERFVLHSQLTRDLTTIDVEFDLPEPRNLEYRVITTGKVPLVVSSSVQVERLGDRKGPAGEKTAQERAWQNEREFLDGYLRNVTGLIHVGANLGQERRYYWLIGLDVVWVEPIREIFEKLVDNLAGYPRQRAVNALLSSRSGESIEFQIANNNGASSSILDLQDHAVIFPDVSYVERRTLVSKTLKDLVEEEGVSPDHYQALTLDVEGAEQLILEGAGDLLSRFEYVKCEVADFPARAGTPTVADLDRILTAAGFSQLIRRAFADGPDHQGTFWDIVWKKVIPGTPLHELGYPLPMVVNPTEVEDIEKCPS